MRPNMGGDAHQQAPRPRKAADVPSSSSANPSHGGACPTSFFLRSEEEMQQAVNTKQSPRESPKESTYGVQSLEDALDTAFGDKGSNGGANESAIDKSDKDRGSSGSSPRSKRRAEEARKWSREVEQVQRELADLTSKISSPSPSQPARKPSATKMSESFMTTASSSSKPLTPVHFELSPGPASDLPSTPKSVSLKSFRLSDEDDEAASQAIFSGEEDEEEEARNEEDNSVPQLVMPSIQMPARRPFTDKGKNMGRLKVLIAGEAGVGKSSLIRSIVQLCEDIVHVDPLASSPPIIQTPEPPKSRSKRRKYRSSTTRSITEVYASTRAYPSWWSDIEESRVLRRRKSMGDTVLERNLCFVDTPGFDAGKKSQEQTELVVQYIEGLLHKNASVTAMSDGDLLGMLSGNGGVQVDVVFFLIRPSDDAGLNRNVEHISRLSTLTNVIPLISHSDVHDVEKITSYKTTLLRRLESSSVRPFLFGKSIEEAIQAAQAASEVNQTQPMQNPFFDIPKPGFSPGPFAVTSASASDNDVMDASLLMSPDYIQPLVISELSTLVNQIFTPDTVAWLRHAAVKKFLRWRSERVMGESLAMHGADAGLGLSSADISLAGATAIPPQHPFSAPSASGVSSILSSPSPSQVLIPRPGTGSTAFSLPLSSSPASPVAPGSSYNYNYTLARLADHTQREERLAQVRLARWASDLQRSLANERRRFEELERGKRARWLLEQIGQETLEGRIAAVPALDIQDPSTGGVNWALTRQADLQERLKREARWAKWARAAEGGGKGRRMDPRDPLGLCEWSDEVRKGGWVVVQVLGGVGVVGAIVVAVWRTWGQGEGGTLGAWFGEWSG